MSSRERRKTVLVLYYTRGIFPLRNTIEKHLYAWKLYSTHNVVYVNVAFGFPERLIRKLDVDVVIFHTIFLGMRWSPSTFRDRVASCGYLRTLNCIKIALPQDEFLNTDLLNDFIVDFGVTHVFSCAYAEDWPVIYDRVDFGRVHFKTVLTGYLDPETVSRIQNKKSEVAQRDVDIGYRAWKAEYWLGEHGVHKVRIADVFERAANERGLKTDISMRNEDVLAGDDWFDFLLRCRATIGVEGGASVLDRNGEIRRCVDDYLKQYPQASFEQTRRYCFPNGDHKIGLACISPRHLEACATETCQFLIEGRYNDILVPWRHYIPVKKDYSNVTEALEVLTDDSKMRHITSAAYREVVCSNRWTYREFVHEIEEAIIESAEPAPTMNPRLRQLLSRASIKLNDLLNWQFIRMEVWFVAGRQRTKLARLIYYFLIRLRGAS